MKYKRAFSLAEIMIAVIFMGIVASLTLPATVGNLKSKEYRTAYTEAYKKVKDVAASTKPTSGLEPVGQELWATLDSSLSAIGYAAPSESLVTQNGKIIKDDDLKPAAVWEYLQGIDDLVNGSKKIGVKNSANIAKTIHGALSPWIVTSNGMAFAVDFNSDHKNYVGFTRENCAGTIYIANAKTYQEAHYLACGVVIVDVNGLDKGPNKPRFDIDSTDNPKMKMQDLDDEIVKYDRYYIFIGADGNVIPGPKDSIEHWIASKNKISL